VKRVRATLGFLYDFLVGDDPIIAVVVVLALAVTALAVGSGLAGWWVTPLAVVAALYASLRRAAP
jgi:hypothetical protein